MTKEIKLTQGMVALVDDEDFEWLNQWKWYAHHSKKTWYAQRAVSLCFINQKTIPMHRVIMDAPDGMGVDHKDGNGLNNQRDNLRLCTTSQNAMNRTKDIDNTSGYKGVTWDKSKNKWLAQIRENGINNHIGRFTNPEEAARAYDKAALEFFGEFAYLNFPEDFGLPPHSQQNQ